MAILFIMIGAGFNTCLPWGRPLVAAYHWHVVWILLKLSFLLEINLPLSSQSHSQPSRSPYIRRSPTPHVNYLKGRRGGRTAVEEPALDPLLERD